jgi:hypothetical protein
MDWIKVEDCVFKDDENLFVININVDMLPIKAFYDDLSRCFLCLEVFAVTIPISVTRVMKIPNLPSMD